MAYNLKGITLEITADSTGLQKEIAKIKSSVKGIDSTMSKLKNSMKFNANDFSSISSYQTLLNDKIKNTTKQLTTYNKAIANYPKTQSEWTKAVSNTKNELTKYSSSLKSTQSEIQNLTKTQSDNVSKLKSNLATQQSSLKSMSTAYDETRKQVVAWQQAASSRTRTIDESKKALTSLEKQETKLINSMSQTKTAISSTEAELAKYATGHDTLSQKIATAKEKEAELSATVGQLSSKMTGLGSTFEESQQHLATLMATSATTRNELIELENAFISTDSSVLKMYTSLGKVSSATDKLANLTKGMSMLSGVTLVAATASAVSFEDAWTGVTKTVDGTEEQLSAVNQGLKELATSTSSSYETIASYGEMAGQMGVATENVVAFTKTITMLGDTTNLVGEEAAQALAKFKNIMQGTGDVAKSAASDTNTYYEKLGSTIVDLGNNFATTESDIVEMSERLAVGAKQVGINEQGVLALSTALSSLGIKAEAGGSSVATVLKNIQTEVDTSGDHLEEYARVAGMSAEQFKQAWNNDALGTFQKILKGISSSADGVNAELNNLGITSIRQSQAIGALAQSTGVLDDAISTSNKAWAENTAMVNEAEKRYATLKSQLSQTWEAIKQAGNDLGQALTPTLTSFLKVIKNLALGFTELDDNTQETVAKVLLFTTALSPMLKLTSKVTSGLQSLTSGLGTMSKRWERYANELSAAAENQEIMSASTTTMSKTLTVASNNASSLSKAFSGIQSAMTVAVPVIGAATAAISLGAIAYSTIEEAREKNLEAIDKELSKNSAIYESTLKVIDGFDDYKQSYESLIQEAESATKTNTENEAQAQQLINTIDQLVGVENKSTTQKQMLKSAVEELNNLYPDLNYSVDEVTGTLFDQNGQVQTTTESLKQYVSQLQETAKIQGYVDAYNAYSKALATAKVEQAELKKQISSTKDEQSKLKEELQQMNKEGKSGTKEFQEKSEQLSQYSSKLEELNDDLKETKKNIKDNKSAMKEAQEQMNGIFSTDLSNQLKTLQESASQAGIEIPKKLAEAIQNGSGDVQKATDYLNAYNSYQAMLTSASEAGVQIPTELANGMINNASTYQQKIDMMNAMATFGTAVTNAGIDGQSIINTLSQKLSDGSITVKQAIQYLNDSANFSTLATNAGVAGDDAVQQLITSVGNGSVSLSDACKKLVEENGVSKSVVEDTLKAVGYSDEEVQKIAQAIENGGEAVGGAGTKTMNKLSTSISDSDMKTPTQGKMDEVTATMSAAEKGASEAGALIGNAFTSAVSSAIDAVKTTISDLWNSLTNLGNSANSKSSSSGKKSKKSLDLSRISELPEGMSALYAMPEIRQMQLPFETRDVNATNNLSARRLAMFNSASNAISTADFTTPVVSTGSGGYAMSSGNSNNNVLNAIAKRLNALEESIERIDTPIEATVSFVSTLDGSVVTDTVTKNINREINGLNRGKGGRR